MGVPSYFAWIVKRYQNQVLWKKRPDCIQQRETDILYLDFNCAIHADARSKPHLYPSPELYQSILNYCMTIIREIQPRHKIYIAMDGVPPFAKMEQQRMRRYKSIKEEKIKDELKIRYRKSRETKPDYNMISPGTEFMCDLSDYIETHLMDRLRPLYNGQILPQVILSPTSVSGEGEHKIIQDMVNHEYDKQNPKPSIVIYGLDSDMIFLTLLHQHHARSLYLMREEIEFKQGSKTNIGVFHYLDILSFSNYLVHSLFPYPHVTNIKDCPTKDIHHQRTILDYTYLCLLVGNDFLPSFPSLKIREGGLTRLLEIYTQLTEERGQHLFTIKNTKKKNNMNCPSYTNETIYLNETIWMELLYRLASTETNDLKSMQLKKQQRIQQFRRRIQQEKDPYEKELLKLNYIETRHCSPIQLGRKGWHTRYYSHHFHIKKEDEKRKKISCHITPICQAYWKTMNWCFSYYLHGSFMKHTCNNNICHYPYSVSPTLFDFSQYLSNHLTTSFTPLVHHTPSPYRIDISPLTQLLFILPPQSGDLLSKELHPFHQMIDYIYLFPHDIELNETDTTFWWETHPYLPRLDTNICQAVEQNIQLIEKLPLTSSSFQRRNQRHEMPLILS